MREPARDDPLFLPLLLSHSEQSSAQVLCSSVKRGEAIPAYEGGGSRGTSAMASRVSWTQMRRQRTIVQAIAPSGEDPTCSR